MFKPLELRVDDPIQIRGILREAALCYIQTARPASANPMVTICYVSSHSILRENVMSLSTEINCRVKYV